MYVKYRKDSYIFVVYTGIPACILTGILLYSSIGHSYLDLAFLGFFFCVTYTLFYFIKYLNKNLNFLALRIDEDGMFVCEKKNEGIFIPWEKIKHVIFVIDAGNRGSIIIIRQHNKETHYFTLTYYFWSFRPKSAIEAAYRYADDKKKIREVKDYICLHYESIMWNISEREKKLKSKREKNKLTSKKKKKNSRKSRGRR